MTTGRMPRAAYAHMFGPTTGDRVRLADTSLVIEIDHPPFVGGWPADLESAGSGGLP